MHTRGVNSGPRQLLALLISFPSFRLDKQVEGFCFCFFAGVPSWFGMQAFVFFSQKMRCTEYGCLVILLPWRQGNGFLPSWWRISVTLNLLPSNFGKQQTIYSTLRFFLKSSLSYNAASVKCFGFLTSCFLLPPASCMEATIYLYSVSTVSTFLPLAWFRPVLFISRNTTISY